MPIFENRGSYLFVKVMEPYPLKLTLFSLQEFAESCSQEQLDKALVDGLMLESPIRSWDRYQIGENLSESSVQRSTLPCWQSLI